jgi:Protein of unknown function (DUF2971)
MASHGPVSEINSFLRLRPEGLLHHYTTSAGLIGIFETRTIWATSVRHLNDSEEYVHALKLLRELLESRLDGEFGDKKALFEEWLKNMQTDDKGDSFVASFSEVPDLLSQWRAYADCDNAYSVGFNGEELKEITKRSECVLVKCVYSASEQKRLLNCLADSMFKRLGRMKSSSVERRWEWSGRTYVIMTSVLAAMKHPTFKEEQEWRLVTWSDSRRKLYFRGGRFGIVPFYKLPLAQDEHERLSFSDLLIGPTRDKDAAKYAADELVSRYGIPWKKPFEKLTRHSQSSLRP